MGEEEGKRTYVLMMSMSSGAPLYTIATLDEQYLAFVLVSWMDCLEIYPE